MRLILSQVPRRYIREVLKRVGLLEDDPLTHRYDGCLVCGVVVDRDIHGPTIGYSCRRNDCPYRTIESDIP
jgi:hypothetical protein